MATTFLVTKNRAVSTLASGINDAVTSLDVAAGEGTKFPSTYPFHITIDDEIMSCTNRSTDTLTVVRAEQGTVAAAHSFGVSVSLNITAKNVSDLNTAVNAIENQVAYGRLDGWTLNKLLQGAGAGSDPTEIDVPTAYSAPNRSLWVSVVEGNLDHAPFFNWPMINLDATGRNALFGFHIPSDFGSLVSVKIWWVGDNNATATPTFDWTATVEFGADGEARNANTDSQTANGAAIVANEVDTTDISGAFTAIAAGDLVNVKFNKDAESGTSPHPRVVGIELIYSE